MNQDAQLSVTTYPRCSMTTINLRKTSDVMQAVVGAYFFGGGLSSGRRVMQRLGMFGVTLILVYLRWL
jgi:hypothetical protein